MTSSVLITLIALGLVGALAFFAAVGFRGSGKVADYAPNLSKYRNDDDLETKTLDKTLTVAVLIASRSSLVVVGNWIVFWFDIIFIPKLWLYNLRLLITQQSQLLKINGLCDIDFTFYNKFAPFLVKVNKASSDQDFS